MKRSILSTLAIGLVAVVGLAGCAGEPEEPTETRAPDSASIDATEAQQKSADVKLGTTWICIASSGTCPTGKQMFYCYPSGHEADGVFSCKDPAAQ